MTRAGAGTQVEFLDYFRLLRRRWWLIVAAVVLCTGASVLATSQQTRVYSATVQFVLTDGTGRPLDSLLANAAQQRVPTYIRLARTNDTLTAVAAQFDAPAPVLGVGGGAVSGTVFMNLSVASDTAVGARDLANAFGEALPPVVAAFEGAESGGNTGLRVFEGAALPSEPARPNPERNYAIGFVLGLVLGVAGALLAEALDRRLHSPEEAEKVTGLDLLAAVPIEYRNDPLVTVSQPRSRRAEAIRQVRTNVQFASVASPLHTIVVTSAVAGEGKTTVATNLAVASALAGQKVIIVDADLRRPMVADTFGLEGAIGLADVLVGQVELVDALQTWGDLGEALRVLPSGTRPANPSELLASGAMLQLIQRLRSEADLVIFDTPPVLPVTDAIALARSTDGVLLVTRTGATSKDKVKSAVSSLQKVDLRVIGLVANGGGEGDDYYYATKGSPARGRSRRRKHANPGSAGIPAPQHLGEGESLGPESAPEAAESPRARSSVADLLDSLRGEIPADTRSRDV